MTDMDRTIELFRSLGYTEVPAPACGSHGLGPREFCQYQRGELTFGDGGSEHGYGGFGFCLVFDEQGKFIGHGAFE